MAYSPTHPWCLHAATLAVRAITLTQRAVDEAKRLSDNAGRDIPVTVTGHSLGGSLAQITAHHHGLKGETFNAYGAVSLSGYRIPEGGHSVINHVMAADAVSAASPHFGEVRVYARQQEIDTLSKAQYSNSALNLLIPDYPSSRRPRRWTPTRWGSSSATSRSCPPVARACWPTTMPG